jgi:hypothetical protein
MDKQSSTTFILGAGASLHAGYPFVKSMGADLLEWMRVPRETVYFDFAASADFLEERFGDNIEDLFNGVQAEIDQREPGYSLYATIYKPCVIEAMRQWFADIHRNHPASAYERFAAEIVKPGDTVVTFNYDVALDSALRRSGKWCVGDGYGFKAKGLPQGSAVKILKLHGSINWLAILFGGMTGSFAMPREGAFGSRPAFGTDDLNDLGYPDLIDPRLSRTSSAVQPLIVPTNHKQFFFQTNLGREWEGLWKRLWSRARRAVQKSERVVVSGYGMYPIDRRGRNLLLRGRVEGEIEVCCGGDSARIVEELQGHGRRAHQAEQTFFEDWVSAQ